MSNREAKAALTTGKVFVGDAPTADAVRSIDRAAVRVVANSPRARPWVDAVIVFRDDHVAVVAKPPGMLSVPAASRKGEPSVLGLVRRQLGSAFAVHRLDEGTSGLMMFARTEPCQLELKQLFFDHAIERRYLALVAGNFPTETVRRETVLVRDRGDGRRGSATTTTSHEGKRAVSYFERRRDAGAGRTLVAARLETGRTHQIRIHLCELGFPILGDRLYAERAVAGAAPRLALHAEVLGFRHPITLREHTFTAPLADDLERIVRTSIKRSG